MSEKAPFTIEQFYKNINEGKLLAGRCMKCGKIHLPPRPVCDSCYSKDFDWTTIPTKGKLLTYTIIHIASVQFQSMAPYVMGIIRLENGMKIPGMIRDVSLEKVRVGMDLVMAFGTCDATQPWPQWPRYCFRPLTE